MSSTRLKGSALSLTLDGVDYWADVTSASLTNIAIGEPLRNWAGNPISMPVRYFLKGAAVQSLDTDSLWRFVWAHRGQVIPFRYAPMGNQTPAPESPHFVGMVKVGLPPTIGGDAGNGEFGFEFEWEVFGKPDIDDGSSPES